jgi:hypothetical protein
MKNGKIQENMFASKASEMESTSPFDNGDFGTFTDTSRIFTLQR